MTCGLRIVTCHCDMSSSLHFRMLGSVALSALRASRTVTAPVARNIYTSLPKSSGGEWSVSYSAPSLDLLYLSKDDLLQDLPEQPPRPLPAALHGG